MHRCQLRFVLRERLGLWAAHSHDGRTSLWPDQRLTPLALELGCIGETRKTVFADKMRRYSSARHHAENMAYTPRELAQAGIEVRQDGSRRSLFALLAQQDISRDAVLSLDEILARTDMQTINQLSIDALYHQYTDRQTKDAELLRKEEAVRIPADFDYDALSGLSNELKSKLNSHRPLTIAAASGIEGMTPAALTLILAMIRAGKRQSA